MSVKLIPGKPEVVKTIVEAAIPDKVQVEMTLREAHIVMALVGMCNGNLTGDLYWNLREVLDKQTQNEVSKLVWDANDSKAIWLYNNKEQILELLKD